MYTQLALSVFPVQYLCFSPAHMSPGMSDSWSCAFLLCIPCKLSSAVARPCISLQTFDPSTGNDTDNPDTIRHAETPELAREALQDSALLIFKSQVGQGQALNRDTTQVATSVPPCP